MPPRFRFVLLPRLVSFLTLLLALSPAGTPSSADAPHPLSRSFASGERLTYAISWMGITAASAVLEVTPAPPQQGHTMLRLLSTATSSPLVTKFYPVDNRVESLVDADTLSPQRLLFRRREGKRKNDFDVTFHHAQGTVLGIKDGQPFTIAIPPGTQDSISCLYYVRSVPSLQPGFSQVMTVHHDKKNYRLEVRIEGIEKVKGPWGEVEAIRALAIMPFQGIFLNKGNIRVWFTNDARRIPVKMKAKVIIGSIVANLVEGFHAPSSS